MTRGTLLSTFGATAITMVLSLVTSVLIARHLGPEGRGALLALTFWPALLAALFGFSLNEATSYHIAASQTEVVSAEYVSSALFLQLVVAVLATILTIALVPLLLPAERLPRVADALWYAAAFVPLMTLDQHFRAVLQGRGQFNWLNLSRVVQAVAYVALVLVLVMTSRLTVEWVMAAMIGALVASTIIGSWSSGLGSTTGICGPLVRQLLASGRKFHLANIALYGAAELDKFLVLQLMDDRSVGYYAVAIAVSALGAGVVVQSLATLLLRQMTTAPDRDQQLQALGRNVVVAAILLTALNGAAALLAWWWLPTMFGASFAPAATLTAILLVMGIIKGVRQTLDRGLRALHVTSIGLAGELVALAGLAVFGYFGYRWGGLEGFGWGLVLAQLTSLAAMWVLTAKSFEISVVRLAAIGQESLGSVAALARRELQLVRNRWP